MFTTVDIRKLQQRLDNITEGKMSDLDIDAQDNSRADFIEMHSSTLGGDEAAGKFWDDSKESRESNEGIETEAVGVAADPIMDLCDDVGCDPDHPIFKELVRYLDVDQIREFVSDYRRNYDMPNGMDEASEEQPVDEAPEEDEETRAGKLDRLNVKGSDIAPVAEQLRAEYQKDADEWNARYTELENQAKKEKPGITGTDLMNAVFDYDDDIVGYVNIDDLEDKIEAMDKMLKDPNMDGDDIISALEFSISDTSPREELMQDFKIGVKNMSPEIYSKLFMYDVDESKGTTESIAQEGDAELDELKGMLGRSGVMGYTN